MSIPWYSDKVMPGCTGPWFGNESDMYPCDGATCRACFYRKREAMKQQIQTFLIQPRHEPRVMGEVFEYSPRRGWRWLQRLCIWALRKLRCQALTTDVTYDRIVIDTVKVRDAIAEHVHNVTQQRGREPRIILVGQKQYREFLKAGGHADISRMFFAEGPLAFEMFGIRVVLVDWMDGIVALPPDLDVR